MKRAPRFPSRWAGRLRTLGTMAVLSVALGACNTVMGAREGTMEYPGSGAGPNAVPVYVVKDKDTVEGMSLRYGVPIQTIAERNKLQAPYRLRPGQTLAMPGATFVPGHYGESPGETAAAQRHAPGPVKREGLAPPPAPRARRRAPPRRPAQPTPLSPAAERVTVPATPPPRLPGRSTARSSRPTAPRAARRTTASTSQADKGAPVKAADGGTVVYAGNEVRQHGQPAAGRASRRLHHRLRQQRSRCWSKKGDTVKKGQTIAKVGDRAARRAAAPLRGPPRRQDHRSDDGAAGAQ